MVIRAECSECGTVDLFPRDIVIVDWATEYGYRVYCQCGAVTYRKCGERIVSLLIGARVDVQCIDLPAIETGNGDPISYDEAIDFHNLLETLSPADFA